MNFVDSLKKWFFNNSSSAATTTSKVPLVDNTGNPIGCDTLAHLAQVQDLASVLGAKRYASNAAGNIVTTDISANAGSFGQALLVLCCDHSTYGDITMCSLNMIRLGYDGNHATNTEIAKSYPSQSYSSVSLTVSVNNDGFVTLSGYRRYLLIFCKI